MSTSDDTTTTAPKLSINIKGPQDTKLSIQVAIAATVAELKQLIATENENFPADSQRLIYSGRVLKDEDLLSKYALKDGHTVHLVSIVPWGCSRELDLVRLALTLTPPSNDSKVKGARPTPAPSAASAIPSSFAAGKQVPHYAVCTPANQRDRSGQVNKSPATPSLPSSTLRTPALWVRKFALHTADPTHNILSSLAGFNPFAEMGINPNDPNYVRHSPSTRTLASLSAETLPLPPDAANDE